jgi:predicted GNAT family acetyltransferase
MHSLKEAKTKNMPKINISFQQTQAQLQEIEAWLLADENSGAINFHSNFNLIEASWKRQHLATISEDGVIVGFACWEDIQQHVIALNIVNIKASHRKRGLGRQLLDSLVAFFRDAKKYIVELRPKPDCSTPFWEKMGFNIYPIDWLACGSSVPYIQNTHYKIIVPIMPAETNPRGRYIELVNTCDWLPTPKVALRWGLDPTDPVNPAFLPIISPANPKWVVRQVENGNEQFCAEVRYLKSSTDKYLIILNANELIQSGLI